MAFNRPILKSVNKNINPNDDFYRYTTDAWIAENPRPESYPRWGVFSKLADDNLLKIQDIIQNGDDTELGQKIASAYNMFMDADRLNAEGKTPLLKRINEICSLQTNIEALEFMCKHHVNPFFTTYIDIDSKNSGKYIITFGQSGMFLGNRDYYLKDTEENKKALAALKQLKLDIFNYFNFMNPTLHSAYANATFVYEKIMAKSAMSEEDLQCPDKTYHKYAVADLSKQMLFDFNKYLKLYGYDNTTEVNVCSVKALQEGCNFIASLTMDVLKAFILIEYVQPYMSLLDDTAYDIKFKFNKAFTGVSEQLPRWKRSVQAIDNIFGEAIGQIYVKKYFSEEKKKAVEDMVNNLRTAYKKILNEQEWMSDKTRKKAILKLNTMRVKIGYPNKSIDFSSLPLDSNMSLANNIELINEWMFNLDKEKHYNKPVDDEEWFMNPQCVNAYYMPPMNEICFPAAILQFPFFDTEKMSEAENYGAIGSIIGHEMTHGFDNHGRLFNARGDMEDWWTQDESNTFIDLTEPMKNHFNQLDVIDGLKANGGLTLSENLADYGGLKIAYYALQEKMHSQEDSLDEGFTWQQRFFISYGYHNAGIMTDEYAREMTINNEHSTNKLRVNGIVNMFTPWYNAFTEKGNLYIDPENRSKIW